MLIFTRIPKRFSRRNSRRVSPNIRGEISQPIYPGRRDLGHMFDWITAGIIILVFIVILV